jgi:hypothetical protein
MAEKSFADLCDDVRVACRAHIRAINKTDDLKSKLKAAEAEQVERLNDEEDARDALDRFISRECAVEDEKV